MRDLNTVRIFRDVARAGGFAAAHRQTGQARATLSRSVAALEDELGVRLIERSTRSFRLTAAGQQLYEQSNDLLTQLDEVFAQAESRQSEPKGLVHFSVPASLLQLGLGEAVLNYMEVWPQVQLQMQVLNREVDIRHEGVDFALRARSHRNYPPDFVTLPLAKMDSVLAVHPKWVGAIRPTLDETIQQVPVIAWRGVAGTSHWQLQTPTGELKNVALQPRLIVDDICTLRQAALTGIGLAMIPLSYVTDDLAMGRLLRVETDLTPPESLIHAVHLGQRGMRPAVRHLLDWLKKAGRNLKVLPREGQD